MLLLPEGGGGLQPVDQEGGGLEGGFAVRAGGENQDDGLAGVKAADAVDDRDPEQRPAGVRLGGDGG